MVFHRGMNRNNYDSGNHRFLTHEIPIFYTSFLHPLLVWKISSPL